MVLLCGSNFYTFGSQYLGGNLFDLLDYLAAIDPIFKRSKEGQDEVEQDLLVGL